MENKLIACFGKGPRGTVLIENEDDTFIIETVDEDGDCIAYKRVDSLQEAWQEYDRQKAFVENPYQEL